jgi:hypothetical protein
VADVSATKNPRWFDAQFTDGHRIFTCGPFDTAKEAQEFGRAQSTSRLRYTGVANRIGRQQVAALAGQLDLAATGEQGKRHHGAITRWEPDATSGFITDTDGTSWFVSRDSLPASRMSLPVGTRVTFSGSPKPAPGKKYPQAYSVDFA